MHLALLFNKGAFTKILAQLSVWEDVEEKEEPEDNASVTTNKRIETGFRSTVSNE